MAAEDGLKAQKPLAQGVWNVAYDTPSYIYLLYLLLYLTFLRMFCNS